MIYLLDSNAWAAYLNRSTSSVEKRIAQTGLRISGFVAS
jgi:hypothetical protein